MVLCGVGNGGGLTSKRLQGVGNATTVGSLMRLKIRNRCCGWCVQQVEMVRCGDEPGRVDWGISLFLFQ